MLMLNRSVCGSAASGSRAPVVVVAIPGRTETVMEANLS
jgi:hypothetical protein